MRYTVSLKKPHEFRRMYAKGKSAGNPFFVVYCRPNGRPINRLGVTVSTKLGNAVTRNRIRRRIRESYRLGEDRLRRGFDFVIVARTGADDAPFARLQSELLGVCGRLINAVSSPQTNRPRTNNAPPRGPAQSGGKGSGNG
jgi:ribonuclease P protein component